MNFLENMASAYLKSLTPEQISAGLPQWLSQLSPDQFEAAYQVAQAEQMRRANMAVPR